MKTTGATDNSMTKMTKHITISSSFDIKSDEEIPSSVVNKKKFDHPSSTKEGTILVEYDSSAISVNVEETDMRKTKKHTAKALEIKEKQVETKKFRTISSSPIFSNQSKEKLLNKKLKIVAAPLFADENKVEIAHEQEAPDDSGSTTDSFFSFIHHRKSLASISNTIFTRGKYFSTSFAPSTPSYCEASLVQRGSKMMRNVKAESNFSETSVKVSYEVVGLSLLLTNFTKTESF